MSAATFITALFPASNDISCIFKASAVVTVPLPLTSPSTTIVYSVLFALKVSPVFNDALLSVTAVPFTNCRFSNSFSTSLTVKGVLPSSNMYGTTVFPSTNCLYTPTDFKFVAAFTFAPSTLAVKIPAAARDESIFFLSKIIVLLLFHICCIGKIFNFPIQSNTYLFFIKFQ